MRVSTTSPVSRDRSCPHHDAAGLAGSLPGQNSCKCRSRSAAAKDWRRSAAALLLLVTASIAACSGYSPARFAARPPVAEARDDAPIPVPRWRWIPEPVYLSEVYLHRPLRETLDLSPRPESADVNSMDDVARSTWFVPRTPDVGAMARGPDSAGPPLAPFTIVPDPPMGLAGASCSIVDSRGLKYEIVIDPADRPEMRTATAAIAARLFWALGYGTLPTFIIRARAEDFWRSEGAATDVPALLKSGSPPLMGYYRVAAAGWPQGVLLGYAPESGTRGDDPNDVIPHQNRRTMRALAVFANWLELDGLGPSKTVDRYIGAPGEGHVVHFVVGLDEALGAANVRRASDPPPAVGGGSALTRLITLGLFPNPRPKATQVEMPAVGELAEDPDPAAYAPPLPWEPADRLSGPDGYWAAKRMLALSPTHLALAIAAGSISDPRAQRAIQAALEARRRKIAGYWFERVTPLELVSLIGSKVLLRDEAVQQGLSQANVTDYRVNFIGSAGDRIGGGFTLHPHGSVMVFTLPDAVLARRDYVIALVTARRSGRLLPRTFELHLALGGQKPTAVGIRH
jgi:hypothetical protein